MPVTVSETEYLNGICDAPSRFLIDHASWDQQPSGAVVRDIVDRFITPKCYLVVPGNIADGPPISLAIGERDAPAYRCVADVLTTIALLCGYHWHIAPDGRLHFVPLV